VLLGLLFGRNDWFLGVLAQYVRVWSLFGPHVRRNDPSLDPFWCSEQQAACSNCKAVLSRFGEYNENKTHLGSLVLGLEPGSSNVWVFSDDDVGSFVGSCTKDIKTRIYDDQAAESRSQDEAALLVLENPSQDQKSQEMIRSWVETPKTSCLIVSSLSARPNSRQCLVSWLGLSPRLRRSWVFLHNQFPRDAKLTKSVLTNLGAFCSKNVELASTIAKASCSFVLGLKSKDWKSPFTRFGLKDLATCLGLLEKFLGTKDLPFPNPDLIIRI